VVFVRVPRYGAVKTRLAAGIGAGATWLFYRRTMAAVVRRLARDPRWATWLAVAQDGGARHGRWWPAHLPRLAQGLGDLGARMATAARAVPPGPLVIVGSDVPELAPRHIAAAFRALERADTVFGPATDGGYWLIGFRPQRRRPAPYRGVRWSSRHALADTGANLDPRRRVALLETLADIDDDADYAAWRARQRLNRP